MYWGRGKECEFREGTVPDQWTHRRATIRAERGGREGTETRNARHREIAGVAGGFFYLPHTSGTPGSGSDVMSNCRSPRAGQ